MRRLLTFALAVATLCSPRVAQAQILDHLTSAQIAEAIALGSKPGDARRFLNRYRLKAGSGFSGGRVIAIATTPYSRVVALALAAFEVYKPLMPENVPASILEPEVHLHARPLVANDRSPDLANVRAIVIARLGIKDRSAVEQPKRSEESVATYMNLFGAEWDGKGMTATFPIAAYAPGREVRVIFDRRLELGGIVGCDDCGAMIKTKDLR